MRVLIANRGEIAVRLIKSCKSLNLHSTAIYSEEDGSSLHSRIADEAVSLEESGARAYLNSEKILSICQDRNIDVVIPGYGFLSENSEFAALLRSHGIIFAGPDPDTIVQFGLKHRARELALNAGVPVVPGTGLISTVEEALQEAMTLGYPIMVKATAGGGGMGLTVCRTEGQLADAVETVRSRGAALFKDSGLFLEKYVDNSRHIEGQIFGNGQGEVLWFGERECSIQRRHQKVLEESPSPFVLRNPELREKLKAASLSLAQSVKYKSAGTVEFLVDDDTGDFYFLEMNTRLQVEHGVTELCYDVDIVNMMLLQAQAEKNGAVGLKTEELGRYQRSEPRGHAIEVRVYAENPADNHKPAPGLFTSTAFPEGDGIRVDTWLERGTSVTPFFDPLLAKVMVHAASRPEAFRLMQSALAKTRLNGPPTNVEFLQVLLSSPSVMSGATLTSTLDTFEFQPFAMEFKDGGLFTTVQDYPARPYRPSGVPVSGPMDTVSFRIANMLVGNDPGVEGFEITYSGPTILFHHAAVIALCGAEFEFTINGANAQTWTRYSIQPGSEIVIGSHTSVGCRAYLAVLGGLPNIDKYLDSKSTTPALSWGGYQGRTIRAGDMLAINPESSRAASKMSSFTLPAHLRPSIDTQAPVRTLPGPYDTSEFVAPEDMKDFYKTVWKVAFSSSRGGVRLEGPPPRWSRDSGGEGGSHPSNVLGYGFPLGGFSFTGDSAVVFTADAPVQSGFICLQTVLSCELWKVGQLKPGDDVSFSPCSWADAMDMEKQLEQRLELIAKAIQRGESNEKAVVGQEFTEVTSDDVLPSSVLHEQAERGIVGEAGYLPRFLIRQAGDRGLLCEFGSQSFDLIPRVKIQQIVQYIWDKTPQGIRRVARPHTMSVLVSFDPDVLSQEQAVAKLVELEASLAGDASYQSKGRRFRLPMVFDAEENAVATKRYMDLQRPYATYLPDNIDFIRRNNGLDTRDDVLKAVEGVPFMVLGASGPMGLPVMIQLDPRHRLTVPKTNPSRNSTPAGALGTGGNTTAIYPFDAPGGYMLWGLTIPGLPFDTFGRKPNYAFEKPWLLDAFDQVIFYRVTRPEFDRVKQLFEMGVYRLEESQYTFDLASYVDLVQSTKSEVKLIREKQEAAARVELARENQLLEQWRREKALTQQDEKQPSHQTEMDPRLRRITANVNAKVWKLNVQVGATVEAGDVLLVLEAMKMEISVCAPKGKSTYRVAAVERAEGDLVSAGDVLFGLDDSI